jgi:predicted GIY-YIG superfamily endonuclease
MSSLFRPYVLRRNGRIVYCGITNNPDRRCREHARDKDFDEIEVRGPPMTRDRARAAERRALQQYRFCRGRLPEYNRSPTG